MGFSLRDIWERSDFWDKEENAKQKQVAQTRRTTANAQPAQTRNDPAITLSKKLTSDYQATKPKQNLWDKVTDRVDANSNMDRWKRLGLGMPELYQDEQRAKGIADRSININPAQRLVNFGRATAEGIAEAPIALGRGVGNAVAITSDDYKKAQESEQILRDTERQTNDTMFRLLKNGTPEQQQRALNYLNKTQPAQTGMDELRAKIASENDPKRLASAAGSLVLDFATLGVAGASKQGIKQAYQGAKATQVANGANKARQVTTGLVAGTKKFGVDTAKTATMGGASGGLSAYIQDPNATFETALQGAKNGALFGTALPTAFIGLGYAKDAIKPSTKLVKPADSASVTTGPKIQNIKAQEKQLSADLDDLIMKRSWAEIRNPELVSYYDQAIDEKYTLLKSAKKAIKNRDNVGAVRNPLVNPDGTPRIGKGAPIEKTPKTVKLWQKSKFSDKGAYVDVPVIRRVDNKTLYQGGSADGRQYWTENKKYAEQFGDVTEKTGSFYEVDNGNRVTTVYVEAKPTSGAPIEKTPTLQDALEGKSIRVATQTKPKTTVRKVKQIDETGAMTKTGVQSVAPPKKPPVAETPPQIGPGKTKKTRFADKTVPESEFVGEKIKGSIKSPDYSVQTEKMGYESALNRLKKDGDTAFEKQVFDTLEQKNGTISRQDAIDAQTLAALLDGGSEANIRKATQIYERLSEHYTAAGQLAQAAAIIARRSPEGLRAYATKTFKNSGVKITPEIEKELTTLVQAVKKASPEAKPRAQWEVMNFIAKKTPTSTGDKIVNTWRAGLLTAPTTTGGNLLGNTGEAVVRKGFVNPIATAADAIMSLKTGKRTMTLGKFGEGAKGAADGGKMLPDYMKTGYDPRNNAAKYDAPSRINTGSKALDAYINGTYRLMGVADMPFNQLAEREALSSIAKAEALNKGLKGQAQKDFVNEFLANPPETAVARAQKEADYATFKNPTALGKAATGLKKPLGAVGDFVVPFTQVPASIATRIVERTPVGTANEMIKQILTVKKGGTFDQRAMSQAIGNGAFGPAIMGIGYALANNNQLTFGYPTQEKDRKLFDEQGKQPYSIKVGDRWYSLNYLQPFGTLLAIGGQAAQAKKDGKDISAIIGQGTATAGQSVMNQSFLKGIGGALDALSDPERSVRKYVEQTTSSVVPNFIRSSARAADPIQRAPEGIVEGVKSGIPGLRKDTTPKLGMFGEPLPAKDTFWNQYVNPLKPSKVRETPVITELQRMRDVDQSVLPTEADKSVFGKDKSLTTKQLTDLNATTGKAIKPFYEDVIKSDKYKSLSDEEKAKTLKKINDVVYGAEKISWGVKNNVIEADGKKLTKDQMAYLQGHGVDFFPKDATNKTAKTTKKKTTRRKSSSRTSKGGTRSLAKEYKLFGFGDPKTTTGSLRKLLEQYIS